MVIELGLLSGYLMVACFSQPSLSQKESSDSLVSPVNGRKGNENFQSAKEYNKGVVWKRIVKQNQSSRLAVGIGLWLASFL